MTRRDWLVAGVVAIGVAALITAAGLPAVGWATGTGTGGAVAIPALPSTALLIPAIEAKVSAQATPDPGQPIRVKLTLTAPTARAGTVVPVTVTVFSSTMDMMSRVARPAQRIQIARTDVSMTVSPDGTGAADVDLPLVWATPAKAGATSQPDAAARAAAVFASRQMTSYQMVLSSPLAPQPVNTVNLLGANGGPTGLAPAQVAPAVQIQQQRVAP